MIDLVFKNYTSQKALGHSFFEKILKSGARELKLRYNIETSVNLVGEARIKELNRKYRNKNKPADVLSFPLNAYTGLTISDGQTSNDLGDIFICLSIAKKQAKSENVSIGYKLAQLTVHGFLHLAGYDHERTASEAKKMFSLEKKILEASSF